MKHIKTAAITAALMTTMLTACSSDPETQTCQDWSADYGLTDQAVVIACQVGENAEGEMTEDEYQNRLDESLNEVKGWIDETGGI